MRPPPAGAITGSGALVQQGSGTLTLAGANSAAAGTTVIGVSKDSVKAHDKFCKKHGLRIALVSDEAGHTCEDYGVWVEKSMYGKKYMGIARTTFVIDEQGNLAEIIEKVDTKNHANQIIS